MISKHIHCKPKNDNYKRLANYIADASHAGEKSLFSWCAGTWAGDDYALSIQEVMDTQALNTRTEKEKTYHLVISFRTEDEGKLSHEDFKAIEERFAKALGLEEHQRHCGVHINTDNMHMHIAYNLIHPETLSRNEPYRDYWKRDKLCRDIEKEYELSIDNGVDPLDTNIKLGEKSVKKEVLTGEESFERFVRRHHDEILEDMEQAKSWEAVHKIFAEYGLEIKPHGNGLVIKNRKGRESIKASSLDRELSFKKLTTRFGAFDKAKTTHNAKDWYKKKALHRNEHKDELWREFIRQSQQEEILVIKEKWRKEKIRLTGLAVKRATMTELMKLAKIKEASEINKMRLSHQVKTDNWQSFLQEKAEKGDEKALEVLQSKNVGMDFFDKEVPTFTSVPARGKYAKTLEKKEEFFKARQKILTKKTSKDSKKILMAIAVMNQITNNLFAGQEAKYKITRNGGIIFELPDGGKIIDYGKTVAFTDKAKNLAIDYATAKFNQRVLTAKEKDLIVGNKVGFDEVRGVGKRQEVVKEY